MCFNARIWNHSQIDACFCVCVFRIKTLLVIIKFCMRSFNDTAVLRVRNVRGTGTRSTVNETSAHFSHINTICRAKVVCFRQL